MPPAFNRDPPAQARRKALCHLVTVAAEPVLEEDRHPFPVLDHMHGRSVIELHHPAAHPRSSFRNRATSGASASLSPCVTNAPSKPACRSLPTKSAKSTTPL